MATQKSNQPALDRGTEALLAEIASTAYFTEQLFRKVAGVEDQQEDEIDTLRSAVARMGWMADLALKRQGSHRVMFEGSAEHWLLPPDCALAMTQGEQS